MGNKALESDEVRPALGNVEKISQLQSAHLGEDSLMIIKTDSPPQMHKIISKIQERKNVLIVDEMNPDSREVLESSGL